MTNNNAKELKTPEQTVEALQRMQLMPNMTFLLFLSANCPANSDAIECARVNAAPDSSP
jgi:hypothetical protein